MAKDSLRQDGWGGGNALQRDFEIFMGIALQRDLGFFGISAVITYGFTAETVVRDESRCKASAYLNKRKFRCTNRKVDLVLPCTVRRNFRLQTVITLHSMS